MLFNFGEKIDEYDFKVINEREARASAGIMFLLGLISLFTFFSTNNLFWAELFSITFIFEFLIRTIINPRYAPYMILGSLFVYNQKPEWVEAKPKHFAWILGAILGLIMAYFIIFNILAPIRFLTCILCLILLFLESAFGICLGCLIYKKFNVTLNKCPGDICEIDEKRKISSTSIILLTVFIALFVLAFSLLKQYKYNTADTPSIQVQQTEKLSPLKNKEDCTPPQWAIDIGHRDMWLKHHGCTK